MQTKASAAEQAPTSNRWMDPGGYWLGALNPNEALNCVDDMNRVLLQVIMRACCPIRVQACYASVLLLHGQ